MSPSPDDLLARLQGLGIRLGLESTRALLARLGDPQLQYPCVLVAGSNGKGSTSALIAAMAHAAGYRAGLYTSPHLEAVEERLRIDGAALGRARLADLLERVIGTAERGLGTLPGTLPTYFEALTVAAFLGFAEEKVDLAVIEVGMGGRLDATNLCEPVLSLITSISLEHREHLGDTTAAIAREKAGILRPGRPALFWVEDREGAAAIREVAEGLGTDLRSGPERVAIEEVTPEGWEGQRVRLSTPKGSYDLRLALLGPHQARNLGLAVLAAETLSGIGFEPGFERLDRRAIQAGAEACRWPGRLEKIDLPGGRRVLLDAAHNPEGAAALASFLDEPFDLLFGALADKDAGEMLDLLTPRARRIVLTTPPSERARPPEQIAEQLGYPAEVEPDPGKALDRALAGATPLVACGSIYLIGEIRKGLRERFGVPAPAAGPLFQAYINAS